MPNPFTDVFLVCDDGRGGKFYQIWVNRKEAGFYLSQTGTLPAGTQSISFADINRDGTIDLIFPTCERVTGAGVGVLCEINVAYNQQLPLCTLATESGMRKGVRYCRRPEDLCTADMGFKFNLTNSLDNPVRTPILLSDVYRLTLFLIL